VPGSELASQETSQHVGDGGTGGRNELRPEEAVRAPLQDQACPAGAQQLSGVGSAKGGPEHDRVVGGYQLLDVDVQVGERLVVARMGLALDAGPVPNGLT
jgi:hypothetical protein